MPPVVVSAPATQKFTPIFLGSCRRVIPTVRCHRRTDSRVLASLATKPTPPPHLGVPTTRFCFGTSLLPRRAFYRCNSVFGLAFVAVDEMLADPENNPLPVWHPNISSVQYRLPEPTTRVNVSYYHPDVDIAYAAGTPISETHPNVAAFLEEELPATHPDVNTLLRAPREHPLPEWHPNVGPSTFGARPRCFGSPWPARLACANQSIARSPAPRFPSCRSRCSRSDLRNRTSPRTFPSSIPRSTMNTPRAGVLGRRTHSSKSSSRQCCHGRTRTSWRCSKPPEPTHCQCGTQMWVQLSSSRRVAPRDESRDLVSTDRIMLYVWPHPP